MRNQRGDDLAEDGVGHVHWNDAFRIGEVSGGFSNVKWRQIDAGPKSLNRPALAKESLWKKDIVREQSPLTWQVCDWPSEFTGWEGTNHPFFQ
jgi:hypothetical protein